MKVTHLIAPAPAGGAESAVVSLASGQRLAGIDVRVAALLPRHGEHPFVERVRDAAVPIYELRHTHRRYVAEVRDAVQMLRAAKPDLVHTHVYHADAIGGLAARRVGIPWVATVHGFTDVTFRSWAYTRLGLFLIRWSDGVICVANNVRDRALSAGIPSQKLHVVPNGYHQTGAMNRAAARTALDISDDRPTIGWIGRLTREKGADLLLDALADPRLAGAAAVIIGDGPERPALERRVASTDAVTKRIRFTGQISDAARLLPAFDVIVLSSRAEGTPMVLLEAMAAGVPVAAFAVGGIPDVVSEASAFLAPPGDVAALSHAIVAAAAGGEPAHARVAAARATFRDHYAVTRVVERVARVYAEATARRRARSP